MTKSRAGDGFVGFLVLRQGRGKFGVVWKAEWMVGVWWDSLVDWIRDMG